MAQLLQEWSVDREIGRLLDFQSLAITGIGAAQGEPELMKAMRDVQKGRDGTPTIEEWNQRIAAAEERNSAALRHAESELGYLYELMLVKFWSILEAGIEEIAIDCLKRPDECQDVELLRSIKGPLIDFSIAPREQRAELLYAELKVVTKSALKIGVGSFESILDPLGMAGPVDDVTRKLLLELQQKRHLFVHRRGVADARFLSNCPFLGYKVGELVAVDQSSMRKLGIGVALYNFELQRRNYVRAGQEPPRELDTCRKTLFGSLERF